MVKVESMGESGNEMQQASAGGYDRWPSVGGGVGELREDRPRWQRFIIISSINLTLVPEVT